MQQLPQILLVDDEAALLRALRRVLRRDYEVLLASGGREALELATRLDARRVQAIFCDLSMPDVDGPEFFERLKAVRPDLTDRVLFCSGGAHSARHLDFVRSVPNPVLSKPLDVSELRAAAQRMKRSDVRSIRPIPPNLVGKVG